MRLDRERFLAVALALAGCAKHGGAGTTESGIREGVGMEEPQLDEDCTGIAFSEAGMTCVAWRNGKVKGGYVPTAECAMWDDQGRCSGNVFVPK